MFASRLESLAYRMLGSVADAEDVVQEARLR
ncbi:MAG: sigma factor, partial [Pseudomonadota bacterium]